MEREISFQSWQTSVEHLPLKLLFIPYLFCRWNRYKCLCIRDSNICTVKNKTTPQPLFSVDYNFANSTNWAIGFYANGLFLLSKTQKECFSHCKFILWGNPRTPSPNAEFISLPGNQAWRVQHVAHMLRNIPVSTAAKPHSSAMDRLTDFYLH